MTTTCRTCGAPIVWAKTESGKSIPINFGWDSAGNMILCPDRRGGLIAKVVTPPPAPQPRTPRVMPHWATCPQADQHRKKKAVS